MNGCRSRSSNIKLIALRARDAGISEITSREDAVKLLLPHTAFKSYQEKFLLEEDWPKLTKWLNTISAHPTDNTDLAGINGIDEWIDRLSAGRPFRLLLQRHHRQARNDGHFGKRCRFRARGAGQRGLLGI